MARREIGGAGCVIRPPRVVLVPGLALLTAACWWGWLAWDHSYRHDPVTGVSSGPYEGWQVVGCVVSLIVLATSAMRWGLGRRLSTRR